MLIVCVAHGSLTRPSQRGVLRRGDCASAHALHASAAGTMGRAHKEKAKAKAAAKPPDGSGGAAKQGGAKSKVRGGHPGSPVHPVVLSRLAAPASSC